MQREDFVNALGAGVIVTMLVIALLLMPELYTYLYGPMIASTILFAFLFLRDFPAGEIPLAPDVALNALARRARRDGLRVTPGRGQIVVRLGYMAAIMVRAKRTPAGCAVSYRPYATPAGWGTLILLIVVVWVSTLGAVAILYVFLRTRRFARGLLAGYLSAGPEALARPSGDVRDLLIDGLAEGHRFAAEAYEAQRSAYGDNLGTVFGLAFLGWGLLVIGFFWIQTGADFAVRLRNAMGLALGVASALGVLGAALVRQKFRPRLLEYRDWAWRLADAHRREVARMPPEESAASSFELLAEATTHIPEWLDARFRAGLSRDQAEGFVILGAGLFAAWLFGMAVLLAITGDNRINAAISAAAGTSLAVAAYALYDRWKHRRQEEIRETLAAWRVRIEELRFQMDRLLEDL